MSAVFYLYMVDGPEGKSYIGISAKTPKARWRDHMRALATGKNPGSRLYAALRKYGRDAFKVRTLAVGPSWEYICDLEQRSIAAFDTFDNGYNATRGGEGTHGHRPSAETLAKRSAALKLVPRSQEWKDNIRKAKKGKPRTSFLTPEGSKKISEFHKSRYRSPEERARRSAGVKEWWDARKAAACNNEVKGK